MFCSSTLVLNHCKVGNLLYNGSTLFTKLIILVIIIMTVLFDFTLDVQESGFQQTNIWSSEDCRESQEVGHCWWII